MQQTTDTNGPDNLARVCQRLAALTFPPVRMTDDELTDIEAALTGLLTASPDWHARAGLWQFHQEVVEAADARSLRPTDAELFWLGADEADDWDDEDDEPAGLGYGDDPDEIALAIAINRGTAA